MSNPVHTATQKALAPSNKAPESLILVVDDSESERCRLAILMESQGYDTIVAADADEALAMAEFHRPGIIISDWYMPGKNGLELCKELRKTKHGSDAYFILVTSQDRHEHLSKGLDEGADDFLAKPYRADEIRARVTAGRRTFLCKRTLGQANDQLMEDLGQWQSKETKITSSLAAAAELHARRRHPTNSVIGSIRLGHASRIAEHLPGDVYGCMPLDKNGNIAFFQVDVVGHGVSAALNSFSVSRLIGSRRGMEKILTTDNKPTPAHEVVATLNEYFNSDDHCDQYFTMIYGIINSNTGVGQLCQAGHPHPLIVTADGKTRTVGAGGLPVGLVDMARYESVNFTLDPGDRLLMYSDGVIEGRHPTAGQLGFQALSYLAADLHRLPLQDWLDNIDSFVRNWEGGDSPEDDASLLAVERIPQEPCGMAEIQ